VPDRALSIGTLRYAHLPPPTPQELESHALRVSGQSREGLARLRGAARKVRFGVRAMSSFRGTLPASIRDVAEPVGGHTTAGLVNSASYRGVEQYMEEDAHEGSAWVELTAAFLASDAKVTQKFEAFRKTHAREHSADTHMWQPVAARLAGLEQQVRELRRAARGSCFRRKGGGAAGA
jgi:hypothetical protein